MISPQDLWFDYICGDPSSKLGHIPQDVGGRVFRGPPFSLPEPPLIWTSFPAFLIRGIDVSKSHGQLFWRMTLSVSSWLEAGCSFLKEARRAVAGPSHIAPGCARCWLPRFLWHSLVRGCLLRPPL